MGSRVTLKPVDRENWRVMVRLGVRPGQEHFVSPAAWSLARAYVRGYGDKYEYLPMVIRDGDAVVGYVTPICDPASTEDYWIDDIMIDAIYQGHGYGRAAMTEVLAFILNRYPKCRKVQLTCFRGNKSAEALYRSLGFEATGELDPIFSEPNYAISGKPLDAFR